MSWEPIAAMIATGLGMIGGGVRWILTWYLSRKEAHELLMAQRFQTMQDRFLAALEARELANEKERDADREKLERHRTEHLSDTKAYAQSLAEVTRLLQRRESSRPGS